MPNDGIELFKVPAGTLITRTDNGLVFCEPGKSPYTVQVVIHGYRAPVVIKTMIAPDCVSEITVGLAR